MAQQVKRWLADPVDSIFLQVPRALIASLLAAALDCGILFFLVEFSGCQRVPAAILAYLAGGVVQFVLCSYWVFPGAPRSVAAGFLTFTVLSLFGLIITWGTVALLRDVHLSLAKLVALVMAFSWNFLSRKYLLFSGDLSL